MSGRHWEADGSYTPKLERSPGPRTEELIRKLQLAHKALRRFRQTLHETHHDGDPLECRKVVCDMVAKALEER